MLIASSNEIKAPLLSPLGDDRIRIVHLILNATFGNQSSPRGGREGGFCFSFLIKVEHFLDRNGDRRVVFWVYLHDVSHHVPPFLRDRIDAIRCVLRVTFTRALLIPEEDIGVFVPKDGIVAYSAVLDHLDEFRPDSGMSLLILFLTAWLEEHFECKSCHSQVFLKLKRPPLIPLGGRLTLTNLSLDVV